MEIKFNHGSELIITLIGRLDTTTSIDVSNAISKEEINENKVIIDMKEIEYISSAGLRLLLALKKELDSKNKVLEIHNLNDVCLEIFNITGFINILTVK